MLRHRGLCSPNDIDFLITVRSALHTYSCVLLYAMGFTYYNSAPGNYDILIFSSCRHIWNTLIDLALYDGSLRDGGPAIVLYVIGVIRDVSLARVYWIVSFPSVG